MRKFWLVLGIVLLAGLLYQLGVRNGRVEGSAKVPAVATATSGEAEGGFSRAPVRVPRTERPSGGRSNSGGHSLKEVSYRTLPPEVSGVLSAIAADGPYGYPRDGVTFQNRERILPSRDRGHYREFTVRTPGSKDRGARRIVTGGQPVTEWYYTDDHYRSFSRITDAREVTP